MRIKAVSRLMHADNSITEAGEEVTVSKELGAKLVERGKATEVKAEPVKKEEKQSAQTKEDK